MGAYPNVGTPPIGHNGEREIQMLSVAWSQVVYRWIRNRKILHRIVIRRVARRSVGVDKPDMRSLDSEGANVSNCEQD